MFKIDKLSYKKYWAPFACIAFLLFLFLISILIEIKDRDIKTYPILKIPIILSKILFIYPLLSIFLNLPKYRRLQLSLQVFTSQILIFTGILGIYILKDSQIERYEKTFEETYSKQLHKGLIGWALAQPLSISVFFCSYFSIRNLKVIKCTLIYFLILTLLSCGIIIGLTLKFYFEFCYYWALNFIIFSLIDLIFVQFIYTLRVLGC